MSMENAMSKKLNGRGGRFVLLAAALLFAWGLRADTATVDGYTYTYSVTDGKATIGTGETVKTAVSPKPTGRLTVPSELGGYPVTGLGESAFYNCTGVTDVTIPNGVTHIGPRAFSCCSGLVNVTIGSGVTSIEPYVFPSCVNLRNIAVDPANTAYMSQDGMLLTKDGTMLVYGVGGDVEIPSGVATIGTSAFFGRKLKSIRFSGSVTNIGSWAFGFCHDLDMSIPNTILKIGDYAFVECRNLNLWLPRRFEGNLNSSVFKQCSNLTVNYYDQVPVVAFRAEEGVVEQRECLPGTKVGSLPPASTCEGYAFEGWWTAADGEQATAETVVTNDVTYYAKWRGTATVDSYTYTYSVLNGQAEIGASNAWTRAISPSPTGHVAVPSSLGGFPVVGIGDYAFYGSYSAHYKLESVTIPNGVTRIGKRAFSGCPNLTDVTIPASMAVVDNGAFSGCSNLKGVHISNLVNWCQITFVYSSNPLRQAHELYLNGERVTRLAIPESVTAIGDDAFAGCSGLTEVAFPNSVTNIGNSSFMGCSGLMELALPSSVVKIGTWAFRGCSGLTEVEIPHGVKVIGGGVFSDCSSLTKITVDPGNENYVSQKGLLLTKDGKTLMEGVNGTVVIPSSVTSIAYDAFAGRGGLTQVTLPNGIRTIDALAFSDCDSLTEVVIPSSVVNIGRLAFVRSGLTSISVEEGNEFYSSRNGMLLSKDGTTLIQGVNGEVEFPPCVRMIGEMAFMRCSGLTRLVIPDSVTNIASKAFAYYRDLTDAWLPRHLEGKFSANVFEDCGNMTLHYYDRAYTVTFQTEEGIVEQRQCPAGMSFDTLPPSPSRDGYAFEGWWTAVDGEQASEATVVTNSVTYYAKWRGTATVDDYTYTYSVLNGQAEIGSSNAWTTAVSPKPTGHVVVPSSLGGFPVVGIGKRAFSSCFILEGVTIPEGVTAIGEDAFAYCYKLEDVTIPEGVVAIGEYAFGHCSKLEGVTIPESVTSIGQFAFQWCGGLKSVHISDLAKWCQIKFGDRANPLYQAHELYLNGEHVTKLVIPEGVTSIGSYAFAGCSGLTEVMFPNSVTNIGGVAFMDCSGLMELALPGSVVEIGTSAFRGCSGLTEVEIPHGVKAIGGGVFSDCSSLTKITVEPGNENYVSQNGLLLTKDGKTLKEGVNGTVVIPSSVTRINNFAFSGRDSLTQVTIPNGIREIGWFAFSGCDSLTKVVIPSSVVNIEPRAFVSSGLTSIAVEEGNEFYSSRNGMLLSKDGTTLIQGVNGEVEFPPCVRMIGEMAFMRCSGLTRLVIPDSVTNIASKAFAYYRDLTDAWLPRHLEGKFSANVFEDCGNMTLHYYDRAYTVTFQTEEGIVEQRQCPAGMSFDTLPPSPSRDGYAFEGWWTAVDGEQASEATVVTNSVTYYAKWRGTATVDDYTYTYSVLNGQAEIGASNTWTTAVSPKPTGHVAVPSSLGGFPVMGIGAYAFGDCYGLEGVTIPEGVTTIGEWVFSRCQFEDMTIPKSVTSIGRYAFNGCSKLKSVHISDLTAWCQIKFGYHANPLREAHELYLNGERVTKLVLPEGLKAVGADAFAGCSGLTEVTIPDGVTAIGNSAFSGCSGLTEVTIPNGVTAIGNSAFSGCSGLTEVTISNGVTAIGDSAFSDCSGLTEVTIPDSVTIIGNRAFSGCSGLTEVEISHGVEVIHVGVFEGCSGLTKITVDSENVNYMSMNGLLLTKDGKTLKEGVNGEVVIPSGVTVIDSWAFADRDGLTKVTIPAGVGIIGLEAFYGCDGLVDVAIPGSVTVIGERAFATCSRLMNISVETGNKVYSSRNGMLLTKDGTFLIQGVNGEVEFPPCVRMIGTQAFEGCSGLTRLVIPESVTNIASWAFAYYRGLTDVMIPDDIQFVGDDAFGNCGRLANVTMPVCLVERSGYFGSAPRAGNVFNSTGIENATLAEGATCIGSYALAWTFNDKTVPAHVTIPNSVTSICKGAFYYCPGLKNVKIPESVVSIDKDAFYDCGGLTEVTIPNSVTNIEADAFPHCTRLGSVTVPACVLEVGLSDVFSGTTSITNVVLAEGVQDIARGALGSRQSFLNLEHVFIPGSVTNIDVEVFRTFQGKIAVTVDPANVVYSSRDGMLLTKDGTRLLQGVNGDVTIPSSVTSIGERAFYNCSNLTDLMIPDSVTDIGDSAFGNCRSLRNVWLPKHLEGKLGSTVFANCGNATLNYYDALYCVTFRTEEGVVEQRPCPDGMKVGTLPSTPTHEGYAFEGWWTAADGEKATEKTVITNDVTYYAKWRGTAVVGDYTYMYSVLNGQAEIGKGESSWEAAVSPKPTGDVVIPSTLNGYPVTGIGRYAFYGFGPTSFEIPEGVVDIRKFAFRYSSLTNVVIPSSVTGIHVWAFEFCDRLVNFTVDPANAVYSSRNGLLLSKDGQTLVRGVNGKVVIPSCVTEIGGSAFEGCRSLRSVVIPDSVLGIGTNAFQYCQALKNMAIPQSVTNIGTRAFTGCSSMENFSVDVANGFYTSWEGMLLTKDAETLIRGNMGNDGEVVIPDGVKVIDEFAFDDLLGLEYVTIPSSVTTIGDSAFEECWNLTQISIPNSVKTIGTRVFFRCMSLTSVTLPNSLTTIGSEVFAGGHSLTSIEIPRGVTEIGFDAFYGCTGLVSRVVVPNSVTNIERGAFTLCKGLKEVWLPRSLEDRFYPGDVFRGCGDALALNYYDTPLHTIVFRSEEGADKWRLCPAGVTLGDLPPSPTRAGAVFSGWWTADGEPVSTETVVTGDMTLEARWHVVAAPEIIPMNCNGAAFWDRCYVEIMCADTDAVIYYSTDGQIPHLTEAYRYKGEFRIDRTTTIRAIAVLDGVRSACVTATFERECSMPQYRDGSYDYDAVELTFTTGGDAGWDYSWTEDYYRYGDCLRSGLIGNEQESWLQTSVVGRGTFSFRWKVDCEYDDFGEAAWDHLAVFTNGVEAVRMDGTRGWERMSFTFDDDGRHTIRWVFVKDGYDEEDAAYEDCAWLGRFSWNPADVAVDVGKGKTVTVPGTWLGKRTMRAATDVAANGRRVWECYLLGLDPEEADDDFRIASFEVVDGVPAFTFSHTRDGSGVSFEPRIRILGKARLDDAAWTEMPEGGDPALRFFKAEVALP